MKFYFTKTGKHIFDTSITGDVYTKHFAITMKDKPLKYYTLYDEAKVLVRNSDARKAPTGTQDIIIPPGDYTLELLQQIIPGIKLSRSYCDQSVIELTVQDGVQLAFNLDMIQLLGLDPPLADRWLTPGKYEGKQGLYYFPPHILIKIPEIYNEVIINGKKSYNIIMINHFDKKQQVGVIKNINQLNIEVLDLDGKPLEFLKFHLELEIINGV